MVLRCPQWTRPFASPFRKAILEELERPVERRVACFDGDGTLWLEDIGEAFLRWLLAGPLEHLVERDPRTYEKYEERVRRDLVDGYGWAVQLMAGLAERDVGRWARQHAAAWPNYRSEMVSLLRGLAAEGVEVWIVSASNRWVVAETARRMGIDPGRVIAIESEVAEGVLTDRLVQPVPCMAGKVAAIDRRIGKRPDLAVGDGMGDFAMLDVSVRPLAVGTRRRKDAPLLRAARERRWPIHLF
jgi:HAD superfamily phosphoserine phosphatase-like hydrolase